MDNKKSNKYRTIMNCSCRILSKVFMAMIYKSKAKKNYKILASSFRKQIKNLFFYYLNYKYENDYNKNELNSIDYLLNLNFGDFLKSVGFPFKDGNCSIELPDSIKNKLNDILNDILNENDEYESKKIKSFKKKNIFLDELKGNNKPKEEKEEPKNNYHDGFFNRGDNKLFIKLLEKNCSEIIYIITSENYQQQAIDKYLNKKRIFFIIKSSEISNINNEINIKIPTNDENINILNETNFNEENNQQDFYLKKELIEKIENNLTNCSTSNNEITNNDELPKQENIIIEETEEYYIVNGVYILKNYKSKLNEIFQEIFVINKNI